MGAFKLLSIIIITLCFFSCKEKDKKEPLEIYHLEPDDIVNRQNDGQGWYSKQREDFFVVKNFDFNNEAHKIKIDSFIIDYIKNDNFLIDEKNALWGLVFFGYGDGITEHTKHEYNTDYTIHNLFAPNKKICSYSFNTRNGYISSFYRISHKSKVINKSKRKLIEGYFKTMAPKNSPYEQP